VLEVVTHQLFHQEMSDDLRVRVGGEDAAVGFQVLLQLAVVDQVAVVGQRDGAALVLDGERLAVLQLGAARRRVADVPDAGEARQPLQPLPAKIVGHQAHALVGDDAAAPGHRDAGGLLSPVLQCLQGVINVYSGGVPVLFPVEPDAHDATLVFHSPCTLEALP
jgi:hypothetical protein